MALTASTAQWSEPEGGGASARLTRAFLVLYHGVYVFASRGPGVATLAPQGDGTLRVDDDVAPGRRLAVDALGRLTFY
ncbi:MAG TPA: hypothetical protein VFH27_10855 [Longimicrobiaceae bacterium]|nr:hypothetical protein [Longimicrobiaceae bacterium]